MDAHKSCACLTFQVHLSLNSILKRTHSFYEGVGDSHKVLAVRFCFINACMYTQCKTLKRKLENAFLKEGKFP